VLLVASLVVSALQGTVGFALSSVGIAIGGLLGIPVATFLSTMGMGISSLLFSPFFIAVYAVLYVELRVRSEGEDLGLGLY
jgi:hypothetical protein